VSDKTKQHWLSSGISLYSKLGLFRPLLMPVCPNCNNVVSETSYTFCPRCGAALPRPFATNVPPSPSYVAPGYVVPSPKKSGLTPTSKVVIGVVLLIVVLIIGAGIGSALSGNKNPSNSSNNNGGGTGNGSGNTGGTGTTGGTYYFQVTQSGVSCNGGYTWTLGYSHGSVTSQTYGCGNSRLISVQAASGECVSGLLTVQASGVSNGSPTTTVSILQNGQVLSTGTTTGDIAQASVTYPQGCS
jgi:hypothetical protein